MNRIILRYTLISSYDVHTQEECHNEILMLLMNNNAEDTVITYDRKKQEIIQFDCQYHQQKVVMMKSNKTIYE